MYDPILEAENVSKKSIKKIKISRLSTLYSSHPKSFWKQVAAKSKFAGSYFMLSMTIFGVLMGIMNFGAYSARIQHWINPNVYAEESQNIESIIKKSNAVVNTKETETDIIDRSVLEAKVALENPEMVYSRSYSEENLLSNIPLSSAQKATFAVSPYENRIIIPRLGKNIPLIDTNHDEKASYSQMHEIFMEELKKGIVRYPGTAKPGEKGNAFIFGHSSNYPWVQSEYNEVFALLDTLKENDEIIVYYNQKKFVYRVTDRAVVKPGDTKVLDNRDPNKKEISLMTCWPIGTTLERLIIFGELVETP